MKVVIEHLILTLYGLGRQTVNAAILHNRYDWVIRFNRNPNAVVKGKVPRSRQHGLNGNLRFLDASAVRFDGADAAENNRLLTIPEPPIRQLRHLHGRST